MSDQTPPDTFCQQYREMIMSAVTLASVAETLEQNGQSNQAAECRKRAESLREAAKSFCAVCGEPFPENTAKWDPKAPVYADEYVYHLNCEDSVLVD